MSKTCFLSELWSLILEEKVSYETQDLKTSPWICRQTSISAEIWSLDSSKPLFETLLAQDKIFARRPSNLWLEARPWCLSNLSIVLRNQTYDPQSLFFMYFVWRIKTIVSSMCWYISPEFALHWLIVMCRANFSVIQIAISTRISILELYEKFPKVLSFY